MDHIQIAEVMSRFEEFLEFFLWDFFEASYGYLFIYFLLEFVQLAFFDQLVDDGVRFL